MSECRDPENKHRKQQNIKRYKYPKWWFQSAVLGVPKVVVGYWRDDGELTKIETYNTEDLPLTAKRGVPSHMVNQVNHQSYSNLTKMTMIMLQLWEPEQLLNFLLDVLLWMKSVVQETRDVHLRFTFEPQTRIIAFTVVPDGDLIQRIQQTVQK